MSEPATTETRSTSNRWELIDQACANAERRAAEVEGILRTYPGEVTIAMLVRSGRWDAVTAKRIVEQITGGCS